MGKPTKASTPTPSAPEATSPELQSALDAFTRTLDDVSGTIGALRLIEDQLKHAAAIQARSYGEGFDAGFKEGFNAGHADAMRSVVAARRPTLVAGELAPATHARDAGKAAKAGGSRVGAASRRAVMLLPQLDAGRWLDHGSRYAAERHLSIIATSSGLTDALRMLAGGDADAVVAMTVDQLWPLIQIVADPVPTKDPQQDPRTRRTRRIYPDLEQPEQARPQWMRTGRIGAQVIPMQRRAEGA